MAIVYGFCRITTTQQQQKDSYPAKSFGRQLLQALFSPSFLASVSITLIKS
jgi:hypothetical protein